MQSFWRFGAIHIQRKEGTKVGETENQISKEMGINPAVLSKSQQCKTQKTQQKPRAVREGGVTAKTGMRGCYVMNNHFLHFERI